MEKKSLLSSGSTDYQSIEVLGGENKYEMVLVFNNQNDCFRSQELCDAIVNSADLDAVFFYSSSKQLLLVKIGASTSRLRREAERIGFVLKLHPKKLENLAQKGINDKIAPFEIVDELDLVPFAPYDHIHGRYMSKHDDLYMRYDNGGEVLNVNDGGHVFNSSSRLKLIDSILKASVCEGGAGLNVEALIDDKTVLGLFPLHDKEQIEILQQKWIGKWFSWPTKQPIQQIRQYFGEQVALYFIFLGHYTVWLLWPTLFGLLMGSVGIFYKHLSAKHTLKSDFEIGYESIGVPVFGAFMVVWMSLYLEHWQRTNKDANLKNGMTGFEEYLQSERPAFEGILIRDPTCHQHMKYFPRRKQLTKKLLSWTVLSILISVVLCLVAGVFYLRWLLTSPTHAAAYTIFGFKYGPPLCAFANVAQIKFMSIVYDRVSIRLNDSENHRTDTDYEDSFIIKTIVFQFVNNFASLFYISFLKTIIEGQAASIDTRLTELELQLGIVFCTQLFVGNCQEILVPRFWAFVNKVRINYTAKNVVKEEEELVALKKSQAEVEFFLPVYGWRGTLNDYTEMVLQFGFCTLFVVAFPYAPALSFLNNYFEIRVDGYKLCKETRRTIPRGAEDIGSFFPVLRVFVVISILTNGGIIFYTSDAFVNYSSLVRLWFFVFFLLLSFLLKWTLTTTIDDIPASVVSQLQRQSFLCSKILDEIPDEKTAHSSAGKKDKIPIVVMNHEDEINEL